MFLLNQNTKKLMEAAKERALSTGELGGPALCTGRNVLIVYPKGCRVLEIYRRKPCSTVNLLSWGRSNCPTIARLTNKQIWKGHRGKHVVPALCFKSEPQKGAVRWQATPCSQVGTHMKTELQRSSEPNTGQVNTRQVVCKELVKE